MTLCVYCHCSEESPCLLEDGPCAWELVDASGVHGVCTNPDCLEAHGAPDPSPLILPGDPEFHL